jgi:hypothetical protein
MTQEALKLALECAERCEAIDGMYNWSATITALEEALAQPQEPWCIKMNGCKTKCEDCPDEPPQRRPLTDEEIRDAVRESDLDWHQGWTLDDDEPNRFMSLARAIEAAHGIKEEK